MLGRGLYLGAKFIADIHFLPSCRYKAVYFRVGGGAYKQLIMWGIIQGLFSGFLMSMPVIRPKVYILQR